jgi:hypothetical protein
MILQKLLFATKSKFSCKKSVSFKSHDQLLKQIKKNKRCWCFLFSFPYSGKRLQIITTYKTKGKGKCRSLGSHRIALLEQARKAVPWRMCKAYLKSTSTEISIEKPTV